MKKLFLLILALLCTGCLVVSCKGQPNKEDVSSGTAGTEAPATTDAEVETEPEPGFSADPVEDDEIGKYGPLHRN